VDDMQARGIARTPEVYTAAMYACKEVTNNFNKKQLNMVIAHMHAVKS
jgi:hypothetical protein